MKTSTERVRRGLERLKASGGETVYCHLSPKAVAALKRLREAHGLNKTQAINWALEKT